VAYHVDLTPSAQRDLRSLPTQGLRRVAAKLRALAEDPRPRGCTKLAGREDIWRVRVGEYRVLYQILDEVLLVLVVRVRHRKDVYEE
jgi:mRNA interferase RelE/StbE